MKSPAGFTLVEMAIVLVIIGIVVGGILKGQQLITSAKIKNLEGNYNSLFKALQTYQDRYNALPGDDDYADRFGGTNWGNGNGLIEGDYHYETSKSTDETRKLWQHLRAANLVMGPASSNEPPTHSFGGRIGVGMNYYNMPWVFVAFTQVPVNIASLLDERLDDGLPGQGQIITEVQGSLLGTYTSTTANVNLLFSF